MAKLRFTITMSLDGYVAGPRPEPREPARRGRRGIARMGVRDPHASMRITARTAAVRPASTTITPPGGTRTSAPRSWGATCSGRSRRAVGRRGVERLVGRRPAVPHAGVRPHPSRAGAGGDAGRHDLPLRHRGHRVRARAGLRGSRRPGRVPRRRRRGGAAVPARRACRRDGDPRRAHASRRRLTPVREPRRRPAGVRVRRAGQLARRGALQLRPQGVPRGSGHGCAARSSRASARGLPTSAPTLRAARRTPVAAL